MILKEKSQFIYSNLIVNQFFLLENASQEKIIQENNSYFVIIPVISSVSVSELLQFQLRAVVETFLIPIFHIICEGIKYYHKFGIIYNRIHPNNIFIDGNGKIILRLHEQSPNTFSISDIKSEILQIERLFHEICFPNPSEELQSFLTLFLNGQTFFSRLAVF
jgi:serine/threonine protein kinase